MPMMSRMSGWSGPTGRIYTNPLSKGLGGATTNVYTKGLQTWISHTYTSTGTFTVLSNSQPFTVLVLSGGQGGGYDHPADIRGAGSSGPAVVSTSVYPALGVVNVTVGGGGGGGAAVHQSGGAGGTSSFGGYLVSSGGGSVTTDARLGTNETWAGQGYGGGGSSGYLTTGGSGQPGIVVIAYRIA